jgi:hypothetical protein
MLVMGSLSVILFKFGCSILYMFTSKPTYRKLSKRSVSHEKYHLIFCAISYQCHLVLTAALKYIIGMSKHMDLAPRQSYRSWLSLACTATATLEQNLSVLILRKYSEPPQNDVVSIYAEPTSGVLSLAVCTRGSDVIFLYYNPSCL